jgi:uncharacterized membrane protein YuzA (DUF378 family)
MAHAPAETRTVMTCSDYLGFASMTLVIIGAINWGVVAIRYSADSMFSDESMNQLFFEGSNSTDRDAYAKFQVPDLIELLSPSPAVQMLVYWVVFLAGLFYLGLFVWSSIETRTA